MYREEKLIAVKVRKSIRVILVATNEKENKMANGKSRLSDATVNNALCV